MSTEVKITTVDNPYDPFNDRDSWLLFDHLQGYHTNERLASIVVTGNTLTDEESLESIEEAMNSLIKTGAINKDGEIVEYKKVYREKPELSS